MGEGSPEVSVVVVTKDRAARLASALASVRAQTLDAASYEIVVVDDGSRDTTADVARAAGARLVRHEQSRGIAAARNAGVRAARGRALAFLDDDCVAEPQWLETAVAALDGDRAFVQGPTLPIEAERERLSPWAYSYWIDAPNPEFSTCNMVYPRAVVDRVGGFDEAAFAGWGEDTDLAWRAIEAGAEPRWAPEARVRHAVVDLGPVGFLRRVFSIGDAMFLLRRHPGFRRERLYYRLFWSLAHYYLLRLALALALPRRRWLWPLKVWLGWRYVHYRLPHPRTQRPSLLSLAWFALADSAEIAGCARGSLRHRMLVL